MQVVESNGFRPMTIAANTKIPKLDEICDGNIILNRFMRSNRQLAIFGEKFTVSKDLVYPYVKAIIVTQISQLQLYLGLDSYMKKRCNVKKKNN